MKTFRDALDEIHWINEEDTKEEIMLALRLTLEDWFKEQKFGSYEEGFAAVHWYQIIKAFLLSDKPKPTGES